MRHLMLGLAAAAALMASQGASAQYYGTGHGGPSAGQMEFRIGPVFTFSDSVDFNGGSNATIESTVGFKLGIGYHLTDHLVLGGDFGYFAGDFHGNVASGVPGVSASVEGGSLYTSTLLFNAKYTFLPGALRPYVTGGFGYAWIDTNIASGPPQTGCWWDPWWGYICSGWQPTHNTSAFTYNIGAGLELNLNQGFGIDLDYRENWLDLSNTHGTPSFGAMNLLFVWRY
jgi:opacity protein-like surface antigen